MPTADSTCPFCTIADDRVIAETPHALALRDGFPLSNGHTLVVPKTHEASLFALPSDVQADLWQLVAQSRDDLVRELSPDGFNIGLNDGAAVLVDL